MVSITAREATIDGITLTVGGMANKYDGVGLFLLPTDLSQQQRLQNSVIKVSTAKTGNPKAVKVRPARYMYTSTSLKLSMFLRPLLSSSIPARRWQSDPPTLGSMASRSSTAASPGALLVSRFKDLRVSKGFRCGHRRGMRPAAHVTQELEYGLADQSAPASVTAGSRR